MADKSLPTSFHPFFQLTVIATDAGGLEARAELKIEVQNLNDNLPSIKAADVVYLDSSLMPGDMVIDLEVSKQATFDTKTQKRGFEKGIS